MKQHVKDSFFKNGFEYIIAGKRNTFKNQLKKHGIPFKHKYGLYGFKTKEDAAMFLLMVVD